MKLIELIANTDPNESRHQSSMALPSGLLLLIILSCFSCVKAESSFQSLSEIKQTAKKFLEEMHQAADNPNISIKVGHIDPRLNLAKCDGKINIFFPQKERTFGKTTIGAKCNGAIRWKLFIPVNIQKSQQVWVLEQNISNDELIVRKNLKQQKVLLSDLRKSPIMDLKLIINTRAKRSMRAGSIIYQDSVCLVCRGEKVKVNARNEFISIFVDGIALNDAKLGEQTQIRNAQSKRIFDATVVGVNQLAVAL